MTRTKKIILTAMGVLIALPFFINPNPFGNNTLMVGDEAYFLSSAVSSLMHHTLPGWDFSDGGAYYGGVFTYAVTAVVFFRIAATFLLFPSLAVLQGFLFTHYGDLLHTVRIVNGLSVFAGVLALAFFLTRADHRKRYGPLCVLIASIAFGNPLFVVAFHTGKMWPISGLLLIAAGTLVLLQEYTIQTAQTVLIEKRLYASVLLWLAFLSFLQSPTTVHVILWLLLALLLRHVTFSDIWPVVKKQAIFIALVGMTQISFFYRLIHVTEGAATPDSLNGTVFRLANGAPDVVKKYLWPFQAFMESHPLLLVAFVVLLAYSAYRYFRSKDATGSRGHQRIILLFSVLYPAVIYLLDFQIAGFSRAPRYLIMFSLACGMCLVLLASQFSIKWQKRLIIPFALVALIVLTKTMFLFWAPSSEQSVYAFFHGRHNTSAELILVESKRLELPLNLESYSYNNEKITALRRNGFLMEHPDLLKRFVDFKPVVIYAASAKMADSGQTLLPPDAPHVWTVSSDCGHPCSTEEQAADSCFTINETACRVIYDAPQTVSVLFDLLVTKQLGYPYFIRRTNP